MKDKCLMIKCDKDIDEYVCNICSEKIKEGEVVALKCNVQKHIFCYDCISDWFEESSTNKYYKYQSVKNMCPMCRKNGGKLPFLEKKSSVNFLMNHNVYYNIDEGIHTNCGHYLKNKKVICYRQGKKEYNYKCGIHRDKSKTT